MRYTIQIWTAVWIVILTFTVASLTWATLPMRPKIPLPFNYDIKAIKKTGEKVGQSFEYVVTVKAIVQMKEVNVNFTKNDEVLLDQALESFKGDMDKGQTLTWTLSGKVNGLVDLGQGRTIFPLLRLQVRYRFPTEALKEEVKRRYKKGELGRHDPFTMDEYLWEIENRGKRKDRVLFQKRWNP